jgi:hypothetical protein
MAKIKCKVTFYGYDGGPKVDSKLIACVKALRAHTNLFLHPARDLIRAATTPHCRATAYTDTKKAATTLAKELRAQGLTVTVTEVKNEI